MKVRNLFLAAALPAALILVGCGPNTTGSGGTKTDVTKSDGSKTTVDESISVNGPIGSPYGVKQGETKTLDFSITRGKDLRADVQIMVEGVDKLKVEAPKSVPASGDGKFQVKVTADADAPVAEHPVKLTAKTDKGSPVVADFKVKVEKK